jgi:hypothetical protein
MKNWPSGTGCFACSMRIHDLQRLAGACSYLLGRRVQVSELIDEGNE